MLILYAANLIRCKSHYFKYSLGITSFNSWYLVLRKISALQSYQYNEILPLHESNCIGIQNSIYYTPCLFDQLHWLFFIYWNWGISKGILYILHHHNTTDHRNFMKREKQHIRRKWIRSRSLRCYRLAANQRRCILV